LNYITNAILFSCNKRITDLTIINQLINYQSINYQSINYQSISQSILIYFKINHNLVHNL